MQLRIVQYTEELAGALAAFNARLAVAGCTAHFPPPRAATAPAVFHQGLPEVRYLALEEDPCRAAVVRGAYALKSQEFWLGGETVPVADFMLPVSEGIIRPEYGLIAALLLRHALARQPLLYGLGIGGHDLAVARFLRAAGWQMFSVPFFFHVVHPFSFLRNIAHLRKRSLLYRLALDAAAFSGAGWAAARCWGLAHGLGKWGRGKRRGKGRGKGDVSHLPERPGRGKGDVSHLPERPEGCFAQMRNVPFSSLRNVPFSSPVDDFGPWSDEVWEAARPHYGMCVVRDSATLRKMYPREAAGFQRVKFVSEGKPVGWALLLNSQLHGHSHFGNMRLGSIVDCLAEPHYAEPIIRQCRSALVRQGADLVVSNQSHRAWCAALKSAGFLSGPSNFIFASSKALTRLMEEKGVQPDAVHLNRGDGDGPINL